MLLADHQASLRLLSLFTHLTLTASCLIPVSAQTLAPVVVTATRSPQSLVDLVSDVNILDEKDLWHVGPYGLIDALRQTGGIQTTQQGGPASVQSVLIRGANSGQTLTLIEGFRYQSLTVGSTSWHGLSTEPWDRVEILRGPASGLYGADAVGGVVQLFLKRGQGETQPFGSISLGSYGSLSVHSGIAAGNERFDVSLDLGFSQSDGTNATRPDSNPFSPYHPDRDGYDRHHFALQWNWRPAPEHEIGVVALRTDLEAQIDNGLLATDPRNTLVAQLLGLRGSHRWLADVDIRWRIGQTLDDAADSDNFRARSQQWQSGVETSWRVNQVLSVDLGLENLQQKANYRDTFNRYNQTRRSNMIRSALFLNTEPHLLQVYIRQEDDSQYGKVSSGGINYGYKFTPALRAGAGWSKGFRAPSFNDLYYPNYGRPSIRPEHSRNIEAGLYYNTAQRSAKLVAFQNHIKDLVVYNSTCPDASFAFGCADNIGRAKIKGLSLSASQYWGRTQLSATLDWLDPRNADSKKLLPRRAQRTATLEIRHRSGAWTGSAQWQGIGIRFDDAGNSRQRQLGAYGVVNLQASYQLSHGWQWWSRLENALNKSYETAWGYNTPGTTLWTGLRYSP
jgi:vitamin B12 transporter